MMRVALAMTAPAALFAASVAACAGPQLSTRRTTASVARSDDPWLVGDRCTEETPTNVALRSEVVAEGDGQPVTPGTTVRVHYVASLPDGTVLHDSGDIASEVIIGSTKMICGFDRALVGMRPGEQRRVVIPWKLAFGQDGRPPEIPTRTDLTFLIDLYLPADVVNEPRSHPVNPATGGRRR
jgi:hypothetical protein